MDARVRWLSSRWPTSTTLLEMPVYLIVVGVMSAVAVYGYVFAQRHLRVMEASSLASVAETSAMEYRAVTGEWPRSNAQAPFSNGTFVTRKEDDRPESIQIRQSGARRTDRARADEGECHQHACLDDTYTRYTSHMDLWTCYVACGLRERRRPDYDRN